MTNGVCIIIAAYNAEATIARAVQSALAEPEVTEIVVMDDASQDRTVSIVQALNDGTGRLKILIQPHNQGPSAARNRAIKESSSPWIGILDGDDFFLPGRIKGLLAYANQQPLDLIADDLWQVPEQAVDGPKIALLGDSADIPRQVDFEDFILSDRTQSGRERKELGFIKPLIRRDFLQKNHIKYQEHMRLGEDFELYARCLALGAKLLLVPAQGYVSVVRANSLSGRHTIQDLQNLRDSHNGIAALPLHQNQKNALEKHYISVDCRLQWRLLIEAVKKRDIKAIIQTFIRPWPVPLYLFRQLSLQAYLRSHKIIMRRSHEG